MSAQRKKVLFDIDDTLLDFRTAERNAIRQTFDEFAIPSGETVLRRYSEDQSRLLAAARAGNDDA